jgi:hypothetical protein
MSLVKCPRWPVERQLGQEYEGGATDAAERLFLRLQASRPSIAKLV